MKVPKNHPRYNSLWYREKIAQGVEKGITSPIGLVAQGRGEAFDYLLKEKTNKQAKKAIKAASALMLLSKNPVISVNGNTTVLCPDELIKLSNVSRAPLEVNLFYRTETRIKKIYNYFKKKGKKILGANTDKEIRSLTSERRKVSEQGIYSADTVLLALEDGDRTEHLKKMGKNVIVIDLNPLSRSAKNANITIVDNVVRSIPLLTKELKSMKKYSNKRLEKVLKDFDNKKNLKQTIAMIKVGLK